jgi:hypothetical protein
VYEDGTAVEKLASACEIEPAHTMDPEVVRTHVWFNVDAKMAVALGNRVVAGTRLSTFDPVPSWPDAFAPQHWVAPDARSAHV